MAVCPQCELCAYFPSFEIDFKEQALNLLQNAEKILRASDEGQRIYENALNSGNYFDYYCALLEKVSYLLLTQDFSEYKEQ